jgi:hypothetical protein
MTTQDELDQATFDGFSLAVRVLFQAYDIDVPGTEFERPWVLLRDLAAGKTTLTNTAELAARFPQLKDFLYDRVNQIIESDRVTAERVLRGLSTAF